MLLLRTLQLCLTPSSMVCPLISIFRVYHCEWACFGQTNVENKCLIIILELTIAFNLEDWPEWLPPQRGHHRLSFTLLSCSITLFTWMVHCSKGEIPGYSYLPPPWSQQCCMPFWTLGLPCSIVCSVSSDCSVHIQIVPIMPDSSVHLNYC